MRQDKWLDGKIIEYKEGACDAGAMRNWAAYQNESDHAYRAAIRAAVEAVRRVELAP